MAERRIGDRYLLEREIGRGGMGAVWLAFDPKLQRRVALKLMSPDHVELDRLRYLFEQEARAVAQLRNAHVVQIYDYGIDAGSPYIVMELLEGEDLDTRLRRQERLPAAAVSSVLAQAAKALHAAHSAGIVHRDLKPANIFLARDGASEVVKILDFGLAVMATGEPLHPAKTGALVGTPYYMSPEQIRSAKTADLRGDLWSLAVVAYRLLTGNVPFQGEALGDLIVKICTETFPRLSEIDATLASLDAFFDRALAKNPAHRFQSAPELSASFAALIQPNQAPVAVKILVVDDEPDMALLIRQRFRRQIRSATYEFVFAGDGESALELLRHERDVDVALTDINMPKMDGLTFLARVGEVNPTIKVVVVSAYGDMKNIREAMNRGAFDFLVKPVDFKDLEATLAKTIAHVGELHRTLRSAEENHILRLFVSHGMVDRLIPMIRGADFATTETVQATVAFVRTRGVSSPEVSPDAAIRRLNAVIEVIVGEATARRGTVDKLVADTAMLVFRGEGHAPRAVRSCVAVRTRLADLAEQMGEGSPYAEGFSAGLESGEVVWGYVGSKELGRMDHTVLGDPVLLATELASIAGKDEIAIGDTLRMVVGGEFALEPIESAAGPARRISTYYNILSTSAFEGPISQAQTESLSASATWSATPSAPLASVKGSDG